MASVKNEKVSKIQNGENEEKENVDMEQNLPANTAAWKSIFAQFVAGFGVGTVGLSLGLMLSIPAITIGELHNSGQELSLNDEEASWFGSLLFLFQPCSSIIGATLQPYLGRKYGIILTCSLQLVAWISLTFATSVTVLYASMMLFGISAGSIEAPVLAYLGEVTESRARGVVTAAFSLIITVGFTFEFSIGLICDWRTTAAISATVPIISIVYVACIPESPIWLLSKGRNEDALRALCWLRGWARPYCVKSEFEEMKRYVQDRRHCESFIENNNQIVIMKWKSKILTLCSSSFWRPLLLLTVTHICSHSVYLSGMRNYFVEILHALNLPIKPSLLLLINSLSIIVGSVLCLFTVKKAGKRKILLLSLVMGALISVALGCYTFLGCNLPWIPTALLCTLNLVNGSGTMPIPWMLTSEVFPVSKRSLGCGLAAALFYTTGFVFSKTFHDLDRVIHLPGCFLLYGMIGLLGFLYLYFCLPETEGKTLEEIEKYFSKSTKNHKIVEG